MTKIASVWNRANGAVDDDVAWVEGFTASQPLNESLWRISFWDLSWAACLWSDPRPERLFWTFRLLCSSSLMSPSTWDTAAETLQLVNLPFSLFARKSNIVRDSVHFIGQISAQQSSVRWKDGPEWKRPTVDPAASVICNLRDTFNINCCFEFETGWFCCLGDCSNWI